ncbi:MAG: dihydropteroate synthase [Thalassobaculales bacterium]
MSEPGEEPSPAQSERLYLRPLAIHSGTTADQATAGRRALPLAGGPLAFAEVELILRGPARCRSVRVGLDDLRDWADRQGGIVQSRVNVLLERLSRPRPPFAGLTMEVPRLMGVVNVTPDSFSDGGRFLDPAEAVRQALRLMDDGADIIDIGGESTRPGAEPVDEAEERRRVLPVVQGIAPLGVPLSVDTHHAGTMAAALTAGVSIVNDVTALAGDARSLALVAAQGCQVVLMHMQGDPRTMQVNPQYEHAALDVFDALAARVAACRAAGIAEANIAVDPGIGFGKAISHNLEILGRLALFHGLGCPVLLGASRKGFIAKLSDGERPDQRLAGSLAAALAGLAQGVQLFRVHDVRETRQAFAVARAIAAAA